MAENNSKHISHLQSTSKNSFSMKYEKRQRSSLSKPEEEEEKKEISLRETPKRTKIDTTIGLSFSETTDCVRSPWEVNRMKGEVIALRTAMSHKDDTIQHLHRVRREMEEVFNKEKRLLEIEVERHKDMIKQLELRVDIGKKSYHEAKVAQAQAEKNLIQLKTKMDKKILSLMEENSKLTEELRNHSEKDENVNNNIDVLKRDNVIDNLEEQLQVFQERTTELEEKLKNALSNLKDCEVLSVEIQNLKIKIDVLESEKATWEDGKNFINRAAKATELEKELQQAKELILSLRESVKGKLLLEEQMATMEHRLQRIENLEKQISELEVARGELLAKIAEYEAIGISGGPKAVRREVSRLQQAEIILTAEEGQLRSKIDSMEKQLLEAKQKHDETKKQFAEITVTHERLTRFTSRLQKKTSLLIRERDSYRQQLDTYEKEITGYINNETPNVSNDKVLALERTLEGYKELLAKYEVDLELDVEKNYKDAVQSLKNEIERLKDELEHRALKGDFNLKNTRIFHYTMNPAAIAIQQAEEKQKALLEEVDYLRAVVKSGSHSSGVVPLVSTLQVQEIAELQEKHDLKIQRLKEAFKASSHEYRQACYQLFGWRVDRTKEGQYKLSSQYAESPDDYLFFIVNEDGVNMIETPFSMTLTTFIERHLKLQHSVPMFLNAVQSDLFDQQTIMNVVTS